MSAGRSQTKRQREESDDESVNKDVTSQQSDAEQDDDEEDEEDEEETAAGPANPPPTNTATNPNAPAYASMPRNNALLYELGFFNNNSHAVGPQDVATGVMTREGGAITAERRAKVVNSVRKAQHAGLTKFWGGTKKNKHRKADKFFLKLKALRDSRNRDKGLKIISKYGRWDPSMPAAATINNAQVQQGASSGSGSDLSLSSSEGGGGNDGEADDEDDGESDGEGDEGSEAAHGGDEPADDDPAQQDDDGDEGPAGDGDGAEEPESDGSLAEELTWSEAETRERVFDENRELFYEIENRRGWAGYRQDE